MKIYNDYEFIILSILDGFGIRKKKHGNAVKNAYLPCFFNLWNKYPHTTLLASGTNVGLPKKQMGNSEVGHGNIGAGRIVEQTLVRINKDLKSKKILKNEIIIDLINNIKKNEKKLNIVILISPGGIHSHLEHLWYFLNLFNKLNIRNKIFIHAITDGRDYKIKGAIKILSKVKKYLNENKLGEIISISGRYYTMDRDKKFDRTILSYKSIIESCDNKFTDIIEYINKEYKKGITDEFITPASLKKNSDNKINHLENQYLFFMNFRPDRMKQIVECFYDSNIQKKYNIQNVSIYEIITMTDYNLTNTKNIKILFPKNKIKKTLGEIISNNGLKQLRIAETEKFPHVTYFFSGSNLEKFRNEHRILIPSPKVSTYDKKPEMSCEIIKDELLKKLSIEKIDLTILNFANPDMVGHTANMNAIIKGLEKVDECLKKIYEYCVENNGLLIVTSDHGNCDKVFDKDEQPVTTHTLSSVPFIICDKSLKLKIGGKLSDIAPTILYLFHIKKPEEMNGKNLIIN